MSTTVKEKKCGCIITTTFDNRKLGIKEDKDEVVPKGKKITNEQLCPQHAHKLRMKNLNKKWLGHRIVGKIEYGVVVDFMWDEGILYFVTDEENAVPYDVYVEYLRLKKNVENGNDPERHTEGAAYSKRHFGPKAPMRRN
jgi:hypothetical protein